MHPLTLLSLLFLPFTLSSAVPDPGLASLNEKRSADPGPDPSLAFLHEKKSADPDPIALEKRACTCQKVSNPGLYCGYCRNSKGYITSAPNDHVVWCNKQGGCEDFTVRTSCVNRKGPCDGRDS